MGVGGIQNRQKNLTLYTLHIYLWFLGNTEHFENIIWREYYEFSFNVEIDFVMRLLQYYFVWLSNLTKIYLSLILERNYSGKISKDGARVPIRNRKDQSKL